MQAADIMEQCSDSLTMARSFVLQGIIYKKYYEYKGYARKYLRAAEIYHNLNKRESELDCLSNAAEGYALEYMKVEANAALKQLRKFGNLSAEEKKRAYDTELIYATLLSPGKSLDSLLANPVESPAPDTDHLLTLANGYRAAGNLSKALEKLEETKALGLEYDSLRYEGILIPILAAEGKYKEAFELYSHFTEEWGARDISKIIEKIQSVENTHRLKHTAELERRLQQQILWISSGCIVVLWLSVFVLVLWVINMRGKKKLEREKAQNALLENERLKSEAEIMKLQTSELELKNKNLQLEKEKKALEAENLHNDVDALKKERKRLNSLLMSQKDPLPEAVRKAIRTHVEMLNSLLASKITSNDRYEKPYQTWVEEITANSREFMNDNRLAFQASHPEFICYFERHGLTTDEINYVCLYALGLHGKEVGRFIKKRSHVNISSAIRQKLGIDKHDTNLGIYVRKLLRGEIALN